MDALPVELIRSMGLKRGSTTPVEPPGADGALAEFRWPVALAADESIRDGANLSTVAARYQAINIKLDKTGGLTRALALAAEARDLGLDIMVGCMVATSLAIAPALLLAGHARFVDLDGTELLAADRQPGLVYDTGRVRFAAGVWGWPTRDPARRIGLEARVEARGRGQHQKDRPEDLA